MVISPRTETTVANKYRRILAQLIGQEKRGFVIVLAEQEIDDQDCYAVTLKTHWFLGGSLWLSDTNSFNVIFQDSALREFPLTSIGHLIVDNRNGSRQ